MKTGEPKSSVSNALQLQNKAATFFRSEERGDAFFDPATVAKLPVQPQLYISAPDDPLEREAEAVADRTVQRMAQPSGDTPPAISVLPPKIQKAREEEQPPQEEDAEVLPLVQRSKMFAGAGDSLPSDEAAPVQRRPIFESAAGVPDEPLQRQSSTPPPAPPPDFSARLQSSKGGGSPLPSGVRQPMEQAMGADFSQVRIHSDRSAADMSRSIQAKAFTHGNDVYFNEGQYAPHSAEGQHLLAHELTHTVQQGGGVKPALIHRQVNPPNTGSNEFDSPSGKGKVIRAGNTFSMEVAKIKVPDFKLGFMGDPPYVLPQNDRENLQITDWENQFATSESIPRHIQNKIGEAPRPIVNGTLIYAFKIKGASGNQSNYLIGTAQELRNRIIRPFWNVNGNPKIFHVDHKHEFQLGGDDRAPENLWLLEGDINIASGRRINEEKYRRIQELIDEAHTLGGFWQNGKPLAQAVRYNNRYQFKFMGKEGGLGGVGRFSEEKKYTAEEIRRGRSLEGIEPLTSREIDRLGLNNENNVLLFSRRDGGRRHSIQYPNRRAGARDINLGLGVNIRARRLNIIKNEAGEIQDGSTITGDVFRQNERGTRRFIRDFDFTFDVRPMPGLPNAGYIDTRNLLTQFREELELIGLSPIRLNQAELEDEQGFVARGQILPSVPFLRDANIDLVINGNDIYFEKAFTAEQINIPAPFEISNSTLLIRAGTRGLEVTGTVNFAIQRVGEGSVEGFIGSNGTAGIRGNFDFDPNLFSRTRISIGYENGEFSASGQIGINRGKVRGINNATVSVEYARNTLNAQGNAELDIRGVQSGTLSMSYSQEAFSIGGSFQLNNEIPRLQSGSVEVQVNRRSDAEGYEVTASGTANLDIPGINNAVLSVQYANGILTIEGQFAYSRDRLSGQVQLGATNQALGEDGRPTGVPAERFRLFGGGSLTLRLTPWLQATAGVRILPNGEIEVVGRIELPSTVNVFDRRAIERNLFRMPTLEIPLFAIPLGPRSIGLVARISGGLDFSAGIGPGQIQQLYGEITYNPSHPEQTSLRGGGRFVIPADASLTLRADAGLGISVAIASLSGGIELVGSVGLQGEAAAQIDLNWSPQSGLELNALGSVMVTPKFRFDANLFARASLDLFVTSISKTWRHNLASFEYGPDLRFGINFPIHYKEGEPFDVSFDDIEVIAPQVNISDFVLGIGREIKNRVF